MLQGEALGAAAIGAVGAGGGWAGPWRIGVRPELGARVAARTAAMRVEGTRGNKIR